MSRPPIRWAAALGVALLGLGACGTRVDTTAQKPASSTPFGGGEASAPVDPAATMASTQSAASPSGAATTVSPASGTSAGGASVAANPKASSSPVAGAPATPKAGNTNVGTAPGSGGARPSAQPQAAAPVAPGAPTAPAAPAAPGTKAPIVLGNTGTFSGPIGTALGGVVTGVQTWAQAVNARGGIDGHPVRVISADDGGDPSRSKSNVKDLVEHRGAVAIIGDMSVITRSGHSQYLLEKRVPVVGGEIASPEWVRNPMYFANGPHVQALIYGTVQEMASVGKKKLAVLYCAEVQSCGDVAGWAKDAAKDFGVQVVYEAKISVAQPDYTAECLQARNSGADTIWPANDGNSTGRIAASCSRQNFRPLYINAHSTQSANMSGFDGLEGGLLGTTPQAPWFLTDETPGIKEYRDALNRYAPNAKPGQEVINGWSSGKLFEKAVSLLGRTGDRLTSADVLRGLYSIQNETLQGLLPPVTFNSAQPGSPIGQCWFVDAVEKKKWVAPHGATPVCTNKKFVYSTSQK